MTGGPDKNLIERDQQLGLLNHAAARVEAGAGSLVLIGGESGIGKTALVRRFIQDVPGFKVVTGSCDPVSNPPALGPLLDIAPQLGSEFVQLLDGTRSGGDLFAAFVARLSGLAEPAVLVFEDMQWADQATADLVQYLGRRVERLHALVLVTFRDDNITPGGSLASLLGTLSTAPGVSRITLAPLSRHAIAQMAEGAGVDIGELFRRTGGNPFLVTEVLESIGEAIPTTVRDAIIARIGRLSTEARHALQIAAAVGVQSGTHMLLRMLSETGVPRWSLQEVINSGLLEEREDTVAFRNELAHVVTAEATPPEYAQRLYSEILADLRKRPHGPDDYATLCRYAVSAADDGAVVEFAPRAAERAALLGAHREAASFYSLALERAPSAHLLELRGPEYLAIREFEDALRDHQHAATLFRNAGDELGEARNLIRLSYVRLAIGDRDESARLLDEATTMLERLPPSRELAAAYEMRGRRLMVGNYPEAAMEWAARAVSLAREIDDVDLSLESGITLGVSRMLLGQDGARAELRTLRQQALERAHESGTAREVVARVSFYLAFMPLVHRTYDEVENDLDEGLRFAQANDLEYWHSMLDGARLLLLLDSGRWDEAVRTANAVLAIPDAAWRPTVLAQFALGRIAARRAEADAFHYLDRATEASRDDPAIAGLLWPARAEAAWLSGDPGRVQLEATTPGALDVSARDAWFRGDLEFWKFLAGLRVDSTEVEVTVEPYRLALSGDWSGAAGWWEQRGCPYEMAITLCMTNNEAEVRKAISVLDRLGATPAAALARQRLRALGVTSVPRGPRATTTANPAGLTRREQEVLLLVADGFSNAEIATRLFLSEKTVERHLSSVFRRLGVDTRSEAVQVGKQRGAFQPIAN